MAHASRVKNNSRSIPLKQHREGLIRRRLQPVFAGVGTVLRFDHVEGVRMPATVRSVHVAPVHHLAVDEDQRASFHRHGTEVRLRVQRSWAVVDQELRGGFFRVADVSTG